MRKTILSLTSLALAAAVGYGRAGGQELDLETIMERKLDHAHAILEALITEDFESMQESAESIEALSYEAGWFAVQTPEYQRRSESFRFAVREVQAAAEERGLESAALGYFDMTMNCIRCHEMLRGTRVAGANDAPSGKTPTAETLGSLLRGVRELEK